MASVYPIKAIIPADNEKAKKIVSLPYDVFSHAEAKGIIEENPNSFLSVTRSDGFFPTEEHSDAVYQRAKKELNRFLEKELLKMEAKPFFYIYEQHWNGKTQTGLVCLSDLKEYEENEIKKHEKTRPEKEQDRTDHMKCLEAQTGNVFLVYRHNDDLHNLLIKEKEKRTPIFNVFMEDQNARHIVWRIDDEEAAKEIQTIFKEKITCTYIADGHHRAASAYRLYKENPQRNKFLTTIFSDNEISILPYNRVVKNIKNLSSEEIIHGIEKYYHIRPIADTSGKMCMYMRRQWFELRPQKYLFSFEYEGVVNASGEKGTLVSERYSDRNLEELDANSLQEHVLSPIFGVDDPRKDKHISFVGGVRGPYRLVSLVNAGEYDAAFLLRPVSIKQLLKAADEGEIMPPKSTWFEPKLLDGFFTYPFHP